MTLDAKSLIAGLPTAPGVYRMLDARGGLLYVGKARNLKKRVTSYFRGRGLTERILTMMHQVADINVCNRTLQICSSYIIYISVT